MLELKSRLENMNVTIPYLYSQWYCSKKNVLRYLEYHRRPMKILENLELKPGMRVLDIGCDWGYLLMYLQENCPELSCFGIDIKDQSVVFGNALARLNGYTCELFYCNAISLDFPDSYFDAIVSTETYEHFLPHLRNKILNECNRVLKPGGHFLLTTPNRYGLAEMVKLRLGKIEFFRRHISMLRDKTRLSSYSPVGATKGDKVTDASVSRKILRAHLGKAGFEILMHQPFIFVPEITPNKLLPFLCKIETLLENIPILRWLGTSQFVKCRKPCSETQRGRGGIRPLY